MTEQILDTLIYQQHERYILAVSGEGLLVPSHFGLKPFPFSTGCYRGYYVRYFCDGTTLWGDQMTLCTENYLYPEIPGIHPFRNLQDIWHTMTYPSLNVATKFTGGVLIGIDFKKGQGTINPINWFCYQTILELRFENGDFQRETDRSVEVAQMSTSYTIDEMEYDFFYPWTWADELGMLKKQ